MLVFILNTNSYKKIESHLANFIVYDLETHKTDTARPYKMTLYRLGKLAARYNCDLTPYEIQKCKKDTLVFDGDDCTSNAVDLFLKLKKEERKTINIKIVENNLQIYAHNGNVFDSWIILINLPCDKHTVDINKNGKGIISMRVHLLYT